MSGGVDSSIAAALLVKAGWDVFGVTFRMFDADSSTTAQDARHVAEILGVEHQVVDCRERFAREVVEPFVQEYQAGRTPNPCVRCNPLIKFELLLELADEHGAERVATGHYVRVTSRGERLGLRRAHDRGKDQSYVLAGLGQNHLRRALFPLGEYTKAQVREMAKDLGLPAADRDESQEICFIPDDDYRGFLTQHAGLPAPGPILSTDGAELGRHQGLPFYTVGQRKGLGIAAPRPLYVLRLDPEQNAVIVGHEEETLSGSLTAREVNWCGMAPQDEPFDALVQIRYRHTATPATITPTPDGFTTRFHTPQRAVTPGQWAVAYDDDMVLLGGVIQDAGQ